MADALSHSTPVGVPGAIPLIEGLHQLAHDYEALFCDVWGVLHNGIRAYPEAVDALSRFGARGGRTLLLSNAPRSRRRVRRHLHDLGVDAAIFDEVITSGDLVHLALTSGELGRHCYYLGPERDAHFLQENGLTAVNEEEAAEVVLCLGMRDDEREQVEDYRSLLQRLASRGLKMICANPDLVVKRGKRLVPCAGSLAQMYAILGGKVLYFGKPHESIYLHSWGILEEILGRTVAKKRVLAIGDGIQTDILGATIFGIDALFIIGGIAAKHLVGNALHPSELKLAKYCAAHDVHPIAAMTYLRW